MIQTKKPILTSNKIVIRRRWARYSPENPRGSGYCEDAGEYQVLKQQWRLWGILIWSKTLDREDIPAWASIQKACFGYTEWKSKFAQYMH